MSSIDMFYSCTPLRWTWQKKLVPAWLIIIFLFGCSPHADAPADQLEVASVGLNAGALSSDGSWAIVGSLHHGISLWHTAEKERLFNWGHKRKESTLLIAADFSPEMNWAVTSDPATIVLWQVGEQQGEGVRYWQAPGEILDVALTPNGRYALLALANHTAVLFNIQQGGIVRTLHHNNRVRSVDISSDGRFALTGSEDYQAVFWNLETGQAINKIQHNDDVQLVSLSADGNLALSVSKYDKALIWNTQNGSTVGEIPLHAEKIKRGLRFTAARFSQDNQQLLTGRPDQIVSLWNIHSLKEIQRWKIPKRKAWKPQGAAIVDVAFKSESDIIALSSNGFISYLKVPD